MMLATPDDITLPHVDWKCTVCEGIYGSAGFPEPSHCADGHVAEWRPNAEQMTEYIGFLESLEPGDGVVICGLGGAAQMGRVESVGEECLTTESLDNPAREVRWNRADEPTIEWLNQGDPNAVWKSVYHVEAVEVVARDKCECST